MKSTSLDFLICPSCRSLLHFEGTDAGGIIEVGLLICPACHKTYPIQNGIPRFITEAELVGFNKSFAHLYDWFSFIYTTFSKVGFRLLGTTESRARQELISRLAPRGKVLEVSIGPGVNLPFLINAPTVTEVFGLDISRGQLTRCDALVRRKHLGVDLFLGNAEDLPFKDNSFDSVFHVGGINFFTNKRKAIDEMVRVSRPGSRILIADENEKGAQWYERFLPGFKNSFQGQREKITAPIDLVPSDMQEMTLDNIWNGFMYCLEFRKPL